MVCMKKRTNPFVKLSSSFLTVVLLLMLIVQLAYSIPPSYAYIFDFEDNLDGWVMDKTTTGSNFTIAEHPEGSVAKMVGNTFCTYAFNTKDIAIDLRNDSFLNIQWMFPNKEGAYVGIRVRGTEDKHLYIYSYFSGHFINTTDQGVIEYYGESIDVWHNHTINLHDAYLQIFGSVPETILYVQLINYPIGGGDYSMGQISYFDNITIGNVDIYTPSETSTTNNSIFSFLVVVPLMVVVVYFKRYRGRRL